MLFTALKKYADFTGRANRQEYWGLFLFIFIASFVATILDLMLFSAADGQLGVQRASTCIWWLRPWK